MPSTIENNYGALASESNDTWDNKQSNVVVEKKSLSGVRRLVSIVALAVACIGVALLVSSTNHYSSISKNKSITSLSKVTYTTETETASYTHAPTPSSFDDDITRAPTPKNLHPTASPVEESIKRSSKLVHETEDTASYTHAPTPSSFDDDITRAPTPKNLHPTASPVEKKRTLKGSKGKNFVETHQPTPTMFGKETRNPTPYNRNPSFSGPPTEEPSEQPSERKHRNMKGSLKEGRGSETYNPTPKHFPETFNPTPSQTFHPTEEPSEKKIKVNHRKLKEAKGGKGSETYNPTPKHYGELTYNPTPKSFPTSHHPTEEPSEKR